MTLYRKMTLKTRTMLLLVSLIGGHASITGAIAWHYLNQGMEDEIGHRALSVASTIAAMPEIIESVRDRNLPFLAQLTDSLKSTNDALFIVIGDQQGIRLAHPNPSQVGKSMANDDGDDGATALIQGRGYVDKALGSLGMSMRGKAPVYDLAGENVIGIVSVGYSLQQVKLTIQHYSFALLATTSLLVLIGIFAAVIIAERFKRVTHGLEPEQIAALFVEREATLQSVREGIIAINQTGEITTINRAAIESLQLPQDETLTGRSITDVLPDSYLMSILRDGQPQFDSEAWLAGRQMVVNRIPIRQGDKIIGAVSSFRPVDEVDRISQQLTRIQQYADTLRSQSHEYSNKLHTIAGLIQIGANEQALELIGNESSDHQDLIHLLLAAVPDPIVSGCLLGKYNRAKEMGLKLVIDPESQMAQIPAHIPREQLVSILGNLIDNALEATWQANGTAVALSMTDLGNDLIFDIEDQGHGISESEKSQIFEKGVSTKGTGRGLGLHLVQYLVNGLGGNLEMVSSEQGGTRVTLYLPKDSVGARS